VDLIRQLGPLAIASRFRRLAEWLYKDGRRIYRKQLLDFEPRWFPLFYLLKESGAVSVTVAAQTLGFSHPRINQIAGEMSRRGFLESVGDKKDERKHLLRLTKKGRAALSSLEPLWADIEDVAGELLTQAGGDFLTALGRLEDAMNETGIYERVMRQVKERQLEKIEIVDYKPQYKRYFKSLNLEWLNEYFAVEEEDKQQLSNPYGKIVKAGGFVLFARLDGKIVGTAALVKHDVRTYELTKMAVVKKARGAQVGRKLAYAVIQRAKKVGAKQLLLLTSPRLTAAYNLYRSLGFIEVSGAQSWATAYHRKSIPMSLDLKTKKP
jgi:N-acetylglutamate synthase-like GNAT family acetyltransferase/DNA-binding MarR family transcriptional regulator